MKTIHPNAGHYGLGLELPGLNGFDYFGHAGEFGNTSGLYFCDVSTACAPIGYCVSYNINYSREVNFF